MLDEQILLAEPSVPGEETAPPVYDGPCKLLDWRQGAKDGMTVDLRLLLPSALGGHPYRGIETGREKGQRFRLLVRFPPQPDQSRQPIVHVGETLLMRWSENDRSGMMARFLLDDGPDGCRGRHPFWGFSVGATTGESLAMTSWALSDEESAVAGTAIRKATPFHQLSEVAQSQVLCRDPRFRVFLRDNLKRYVLDAAVRANVMTLRERPEEFAAAAIRAALGSPSRAVMNQDGAAATTARARWRAILGHYEAQLFSIRRQPADW